MEYILCPKCKTETDPRKQTCQLCGKYIIITELSRDDKHIYLKFWNKGETEFQNLDPKHSTDEHGDIDQRMGPLSLDGLEEESSTQGDDLSDDLFDDLDDFDPDDDSEDRKAKLFEKSKLLKHIKEEEDLFGDLGE